MFSRTTRFLFSSFTAHTERTVQTICHIWGISFSNTEASLRVKERHSHLKVLQTEFYQYLLLLAILTACKQESFEMWKDFAIIFQRNESAAFTKKIGSIYFYITSRCFFHIGIVTSHNPKPQPNFKKGKKLSYTSLSINEQSCWKNINFTLKSQFTISILNSTLSMVWVIINGKQFVLFLQMFPAVNMHYGSKENLLRTFSISLNICKLSFLKLESLKNYATHSTSIQ